MSSQYEITGSEDNEKIKDLAIKQMNLQSRIDAVAQSANLGVDAVIDSVGKMLNVYKRDIMVNYIFKAPMKASSYFALFQTYRLGNSEALIFNPRSSEEDVKVFAAVATSWDTFYPKAKRGENLHNIAIEGMKNVRINEANQAQTIDASKVQTTGLIDIALPDNKGKVRKLTELKGKVVLLDFHVFATNDSPARILLLRELYNKYHDQGFEIYQVSLDPDEHFWKQQTSALPWISVREEAGLNSSTIRIYNVQGVPEFFLIDRGNNLVGRSQTIKDIEEAIKNLL
jgi:peroxiredoxin